MSQENLEELLKKLQERVIEGKEIPLTPDELKQTRQMIKGYNMLIQWGKLGRFLIWAAMTVSGLFIAYQQLFKSGGQ